MTSKYRGANSQRHQRPMHDNLNLTDRPVGLGRIAARVRWTCSTWIDGRLIKE